MDFRAFAKAVEEQYAEEIRKEGGCIQCQHPSYDGLCDCGGAARATAGDVRLHELLSVMGYLATGLVLKPCVPVDVENALEESVKLQSHYAKLLNGYDGGTRFVFANGDAWLARLKELKPSKS